MDYKKIIKSKEMRIKILQYLSFIPDKYMIQLQYRLKTGHKLNLKHSRRFTEKLQWYKLYYRDPLMRRCADKGEVRTYVEDCGLGDILIPMIGLFDNPEKINWDHLPEKCVIKDTLGGGGNSVIICKDNYKINIEELKKRTQEWVKRSTSYKTGGREWVYGGRKHRIIIEDYLEADSDKGGLIDYKFFCFYGKAEYVYVISDRKVGEWAYVGIYSADYKKLDVVRRDELPPSREILKPEKYDEMIKIAEKLSAPFPESRIYLYCIQGHIYFGEITFFDGSGYMAFEPDEFDCLMGEKFILPEKRK